MRRRRLLLGGGRRSGLLWRKLLTKLPRSMNHRLLAPLAQQQTKPPRDRVDGHGAVWLCLDALLLAQDLSSFGFALMPGVGLPRSAAGALVAGMTSKSLPASMCLSTSGSLKCWARRITVSFPESYAL